MILILISIGVTKTGEWVYIYRLGIGVSGVIDELGRLVGKNNLAYGIGVQRVSERGILYGSCKHIHTRQDT